MNEDPVLTVQDLSVQFGDATVVSNVSFALQRGESIGVVGASGSGKTVTSLALMGLLPDHATVTGNASLAVDDRRIDLLRGSKNALRRIRGKEIAMIFQEPMTALDPVYTVGEQVAEALRTHLDLDRKAITDRVVELFTEVDLPDPKGIRHRYPHQLSGGQKQRVAIALALSCGPNVLVCDEPTTALDVLVQRKVLLLLKELQRKHRMGMLFITHDLGVVSMVTDHVLVMHRGEVVEQGPTATVLADPHHPYTKGLLACRPTLNSHPQRLTTVDEALSGTFDPRTTMQVRPEERRAQAERISAAPPLLSIRSVRKSYGRKSGLFSSKENSQIVLDAIDFDVYPGETLGLVGGSGSGKTTLGRCILQLIKPDSGRVSFRGKELTELSPNEMRKLRSRMQIIFQDPYSSLDPSQTIGAAMLEAMRFHRSGTSDNARKQRIHGLLERVGLEASHYGRYPHQFSGGQRQRVVIARALVLDPELVICDESVSALDVSVQAQVLNLLNELKEEHGLTYIFISHDLSVVKYMSDRIVVLDQGKVAEVAFSEDLYSAPKARATQELIGAMVGVGPGSSPTSH